MKTIYIILTAGLFLLLLSMERVQKERTGRQAAALMEDIEFKEARNQYLRYKIGMYKSPDKIIDKAAEDGMIMIDPRDILTLKGGG
jgi:cell division protein FtsL